MDIDIAILEGLDRKNITRPLSMARYRTDCFSCNGAFALAVTPHKDRVDYQCDECGVVGSEPEDKPKPKPKPQPQPVVTQPRPQPAPPRPAPIEPELELPSEITEPLPAYYGPPGGQGTTMVTGFDG